MPSLEILRVLSPPMDTNAYLVADPATGSAVAIDPSFSGAEILALVHARGWKLEAVVLTHGHIDHSHDAGRLARDAAVPLLAHREAAPLLASAFLSGATWLGLDHESSAPNRFLIDGDVVAIGAQSPPEPTRASNPERGESGQSPAPPFLRVLHTPGHTRGCICLLGERDCFTGDLLFRDGVGRWDFPGGNEETLSESLRRLAGECGDDVKLYPGHGEFTTMGRERRENPYLLQWL